MNIAIVENEKVELETAEAFLKFYIRKFYPEYESEIGIEVFQRTEDFFQVFSADLYQLVVLGDGMEDVANFVRTRGGFDTKILFLKLKDDWWREKIMNIAIVDDEKIELDAAENYLRNYLTENWSELNFVIQTFSSANDFLKIFKPKLFQLVVLDIRMPEIDGLQVAQIIRARGDDDANIVFLTASDDFVLSGYRVFAVGYFMKPITNHAEDFTKTFEHIFRTIREKNPEVILNVAGAEVPVLPWIWQPPTGAA